MHFKSQTLLNITFSMPMFFVSDLFLANEKDHENEIIQLKARSATLQINSLVYVVNYTFFDVWNNLIDFTYFTVNTLFPRRNCKDKQVIE